MSARDNPVLPPVAIGGVGGSGTRLIAEILRRLDYYLGDELNAANDNDWFTFLFKRVEFWAPRDRTDFDRAVRIFRGVMAEGVPLTGDDEAWILSMTVKDRPQGSVEWLRRLAESLRKGSRNCTRRTGPWGWKEPNTHIFLDRLQDAFPGMKYIHVMRHGLDMAYSTNQNQLKLWGPLFLGSDQVESSPRWSLKYWCLVHRRVAELGERMPGRFLLLNYDAFCAAPRESVRELVKFLGVSVSAATESSLMSLVRPPDSIGRYRQHGLQPFDAEDVAYVRELGFDCDARHAATGNA